MYYANKNLASTSKSYNHSNIEESDVDIFDCVVKESLTSWFNSLGTKGVR